MGCFCIEYLDKGLCESQQSKSLEKDILGGAMPDAGTYSLMKLAEQCRPDAVTVRRFHRRQYGMKE